MELCGVQTLRRSSPNFKTLHLVRHAQGIHNVEIEKGELTALSGKLFDAHLSLTGIQQVRRMVSDMRKEISKSGLLNTVQLVITSPLRRCYTYLPLLLNLGLYPCDKRESISTYRTYFSEIDFTMIESDEDAEWQAEEREDMEEVSARGLHFLKWLWERPEKDIAVVSHGIFLQQTLRALHEKVGTPVEENHLKRFANCELRSIRLEKSDMEAYTLTPYNSRKYVTPPSTSIHTFE
ncbi:hypothetical protein HID58_021170 [Brassica napus]|uniref:Phosphoglycerate mutase-like protein 1 n=1 Tax=Brassica napus TaxID=3708 RepID=A0ABQ8CVM1_BRANA|nr:hypothetical protein HID58_021170 [Brassica napus]